MAFQLLLTLLSILVLLGTGSCRFYNDGGEDFEKFRAMLPTARDEEYEEEVRREEEYSEKHSENDTNDAERSLNAWTVRIDPPDDEVADSIAKRFDFTNVGRVGELNGFYRFTREHDALEHHHHEDLSRPRSKRDHIEHADLLSSHPQVVWFRRELRLEREKRVPLQPKSNEDPYFNDPEFNKQWYIKNTGQAGGPKDFDSSIEPVWNMGYTGKGVVVSVLDDGMDHTHPDLVKNYDPQASTDLNGHDADPFPNDVDPYNGHGTKCSGTIAAEANNSVCGVGIAFNAKIGAVRMLDGTATDSLEAHALSFSSSHIDIYSCSWGPKDNGGTFGRPGVLGRMALKQGAERGRNGKGSIYVWATGNGGLSDDDCNCDGYVNSIYTMSIGSVNEFGISTYYGEKCSSTMAVTYTSGEHKLSYGLSPVSKIKAKVITTFLHHQCTDHFVGTSSAAPLAAGIMALVLEANSKLTWRDMQHIVVETTKRTSPMDTDWMKNKAGFHYNHKFGFGLLNAKAMVDKALIWKPVAAQQTCHFHINLKHNTIPSSGTLRIRIKTSACQKCAAKSKLPDGTCKDAITKLEHVVVTVTLKHRRRGNLQIELFSPGRTLSRLLHNRKRDLSKAGLKNWSFMTVYNWGENPAGTWELLFRDAPMTDHNVVKKQDMEEEYVKWIEKKMHMPKADVKRDDVDRSYESSDSSIADDDESYQMDYESRLAKVWSQIQDMRRKSRSNDADDFSTSQSDDSSDSYYRSRRNIGNNLFMSNSPLAGEIESLDVTFHGTK